MTVGSALGNAGASWSIDAGGKVYRFRKVTQRVKDGFSTALSQRVLRQFLAAQGADGGAYQEAVAIVADRIALGRYDFHGPIAQQAIRTNEGVFALALLLIDVDEEDEDGQPLKRRPITEDELVDLLAGRSAELNAVMKQVFAASFPQAAALPKNGQESSGEGGEGADPNPPRPAG